MAPGTTQGISVTVKVLVHALCAAIGCVLATPDHLYSQSHADWEVVSRLTPGEPVTLPVRVAGEIRWFMLDSGSSLHIFDVSLRQHLGAPLGIAPGQASGTSGIQLEKFGTPPMRVGRIQLPPDPKDFSITFDFTMVRKALELDVRGVLGTPFFRGRLIELNFDQGVVRVAKRDDVDTIQGTPLNLRLDSFGVPWVDGLRVANRVESFEVDTGSNGQLVLHKWLFEALAGEDQLEIDSKGNRQETVAGRQISRLGWLSEFSCAGYSHRDLLVAEGISNSLGLGYLSRFVVTIDLSGNRIYLQAGSHVDRQDRIDRSGMEVANVGGELEVREVEDGGPAYAAGIHVGDKVLAIDGTTCKQMRRFTFLKYLQDVEGKVITVKVMRQDQSIEMKLSIPSRRRT